MKGPGPACPRQTRSSHLAPRHRRNAPCKPDMVAGGWFKHEAPRMGRADVNSAIGSSWSRGKPSRVEEMDAAARQAIESGRGDAKMNVELRMCGAGGK